MRNCTLIVRLDQQLEVQFFYTQNSSLFRINKKGMSRFDPYSCQTSHRESGDYRKIKTSVAPAITKKRNTPKKISENNV